MRSLLPAFLLLPACHARLNEDKHADLVQKLRVDDSFADSYFLDDPACQAQAAGKASIGAADVFQWQGDASRATQFAFDKTSAVESLTSEPITATAYGFYQQYECKSGESTETCSGAGKVITQPKSLKICRDNYAYPRTSVEGVSLASLSAINAAESFYRGVPGASAAILPALLVVLPTIEYVVNDASGNPLARAVETDNLAYVGSKTPMFLVYPKGKKAVAAGLWKDVNLWEIPWGLAHEYGHHVFRTHTGVSHLENTSLHIAPIRKFDTKIDGAEGLQLAASDRVVTGEDYYSAVNEGYADLFSFYTFGGKADLIKNVDCFATNRDLTASEFVGGRAKILDKDMLAQFASTTVIDVSGCSAPDFQDVHSLGAVVAYGVDRLFSDVAPGNDEAAVLKKAGLLLNWAKRIGDTVSGKSMDDVNFEVLVKEALITVAPSKRLSKAACEIVRTQFPEYAETWLAAEFSCN